MLQSNAQAETIGRDEPEFQRFARILSRYRGGALRLGTGFAELPPGRSRPEWLEGDLKGESVLLGEHGAREWTRAGQFSGMWAAHLWDAVPGFSERFLRAAGFERQWSNSILEARIGVFEPSPAHGSVAPGAISAISTPLEYAELVRALGEENVSVQASEVRILQLRIRKDSRDDSWYPIGAASITFDEDVAYLADLFVLPAHQGRGHGRSLIEAAFEHASRKGCTRVWALPTERARKLYERAGFKPMALLSTYLKAKH